MSTAAPINLFDYEALARERLHPAVWDYIASGAADEITVAENRRAFDQVAIRPRVLVDVSRIDTTTSVFGRPVDMPILIAPTGSHGAVCSEGECATAVAAARARVAMAAASRSNRSIEEIAAVAIGPLWLQLYLYPERERSLALVRRAEAAGCCAVVLTVDSPLFGRKDRSLRTEGDFDWPAAGNLPGLPPASLPLIEGAPATWADVDWLRSVTRLPILLKGISTAEDTVIAVAHGVEGIVVSNHGGRQLDGVAASLTALPEVASAADGRCEIYIDGGVRRGTDVLKALALGARAVMIGRPILWGLAVSGAAGVFDVLTILQRELVWAMALSGRPTIASIDRTVVR